VPSGTSFVTTAPAPTSAGADGHPAEDHRAAADRRPAPKAGLGDRGAADAHAREMADFTGSPHDVYFNAVTSKYDVFRAGTPARRVAGPAWQARVHPRGRPAR